MTPPPEKRVNFDSGRRTWDEQQADKIEELEAELAKLREGIDGLHESLFIGSEKGLTRSTLRDMAAFAKGLLDD